MVSGPRLALSSHALEARGVRPSSRVGGEGFEARDEVGKPPDVPRPPKLGIGLGEVADDGGGEV
jgi:hypothetical protein